VQRSLRYIMSPRIVGELCNREDLAPAHWLAGGPRAEVLLEPCVHSLRLSICAWVESGREILLHSQCFTHLAGKGRCEAWISIRDDSFGKSKPRHEVFQILVGYTWSIDRLVTWDELCCLRASLIDNCEDRVEALRFGKVCDQIQRDVLEGSFHDRGVKTL